jgi:hypothetical protein
MATPTGPQPPTTTKDYSVKFDGKMIGTVEDDVSLVIVRATTVLPQTATSLFSANMPFC